MRYLPFIILMLLVSVEAQAKQVDLAGDYGCITQKAQNDRVSLLQKSMTTTDQTLKSQYTKEIVRISKYDCSPLEGKFTVIKETKDFIRVQTKDAKLWVIR